MNRAFTLIELLVVIAIIGILSSIVLSSLNTARGKANDSRRVQDIHQIVVAGDQYLFDAIRPTFSLVGTVGPACIGVPSGQKCWNNIVFGSDALIANLAPYLPVPPADPSTNRPWGDRYVYVSGIVGTDCLNTNRISGQFILYQPEKTVTPTMTCPVGIVGCCVSFLGCNLNGRYFCAVSF